MNTQDCEQAASTIANSKEFVDEEIVMNALSNFMATVLTEL